MTRTVNQAFEQFLSRLTPTAVQREAGGKHRASVEAALEAKLDVINFFETGSFSHGTGVRAHSDTDVLVSLRNQKPGTSETALNWVKSALQARFPKTTIVIRRPAVVVLFGGGYETWEVIPGFVNSKGGKDQFVYDIPAVNTVEEWIDSAPREHLKYVNECNKKPHEGDAKDLARLVKGWKYTNSVPLSSFYLEMRAAQHVAEQKNFIHVWDICQLLEGLQHIQLAAMNDPSGLTGRFYACSSRAKAADALSKLKTAATRARKALDAYNKDDFATAFYYLDLLFGGAFPSQ